MKFSKSNASTPPSKTYIATTLSRVIAAKSEKENCECGIRLRLLFSSTNYSAGVIGMQ